MFCNTAVCMATMFHDHNCISTTDDCLHSTVDRPNYIKEMFSYYLQWKQAHGLLYTSCSCRRPSSVWLRLAPLRNSRHIRKLLVLQHLTSQDSASSRHRIASRLLSGAGSTAHTSILETCANSSIIIVYVRSDGDTQS